METKTKLDYKDLSYPAKRDLLRKIAEDPIMADAIDTLTDEIHPFIETSQVNFLSWHHVRKYIIDGFLCFERIFDKNDECIDYKELDPASLLPAVLDGKKLWVLNKNTDNERLLSESQIAMISWSRYSSYLSYAESLYRPYSQLKLMEDARLLGYFTSESMFDETESLEYFKNKFIQATKIPIWHFSNDVIKDPEQENRFSRFYQKHVQNLKTAI